MDVSAIRRNDTHITTPGVLHAHRVSVHILWPSWPFGPKNNYWFWSLRDEKHSCFKIRWTRSVIWKISVSVCNSGRNPIFSKSLKGHCHRRGQKYFCTEHMTGYMFILSILRETMRWHGGNYKLDQNLSRSTQICFWVIFLRNLLADNAWDSCSFPLGLDKTCVVWIRGKNWQFCLWSSL